MGEGRLGQSEPLPAEEGLALPPGGCPEYRSTSEEIQKRIDDLCAVIYKVLKLIKATDDLLLKRVFDELYEVSHGKVSLRDKKLVRGQGAEP